MKLPDFGKSPMLISLKTRMGIDAGTYGNIKAIEFRPSSPSYVELTNLATVGLDVDLEQVIVLENGTLGYKGKRVLLHIRDVADYGRGNSDPRFHFSNCETLRKMRSNLRFDRYVVATNESGVFTLNYSSQSQSMARKLDVCQNCLEYLDYNGFSGTSERSIRKKAVNSFSISEFFEKYPKSLHAEVPKYTDKTAPRNEYTPDFDKISRNIKISRGWRCEASDCGITLDAPEHRKYLHTHHVNAQKHDNNPANLKLYCIDCHAKQPMHWHMKQTPDYRDFQYLISGLRLRTR